MFMKRNLMKITIMTSETGHVSLVFECTRVAIFHWTKARVLSQRDSFEHGHHWLCFPNQPGTSQSLQVALVGLILSSGRITAHHTKRLMPAHRCGQDSGRAAQANGMWWVDAEADQ